LFFILKPITIYAIFSVIFHLAFVVNEILLTRLVENNSPVRNIKDRAAYDVNNGANESTKSYTINFCEIKSDHALYPYVSSLSRERPDLVNKREALSGLTGL